MAEIQDVIETLDNAAEGFDSIANKTQKKIYGEVITLAKELDIDASGKVRQTIQNLKRLTQIKAKLAALAKDKEWVAGISKFTQYFDILQKQQNAYFTQHFSESTLTETAKKKHELMKQMAVQNTIEALIGDGLKANVTDKLNDILLRAVTTSARFADLQEELRAHLLGKDGGQGAFARYANTYATTALSQFTGQNNKLMTDDLGTEWFMYVGSNKETTREFCQLLTAKKYIHKSEIPTILTGKIDENQCRIYEKTGLPYGMIEGTTVDNFQCNCGGWNCRHQLVPVADAVVPAALRAKFEKSNTPIKSHKAGKEGNKMGRAQQKAIYQQVENIPIATVSQKQYTNLQNAAMLIGIKPQEPMEFQKANSRNANIDYKPNANNGTETNCASCVIVYEMRRRGLDITAMPYDENNTIMFDLHENYGSIWKNEKNGTPSVTKHKGKGFEEMKSKMLNQCKAVGRYHIGINWRDGESEKGHVITAERLKNGSFIFYDPQNGSFINFDEYIALDMLYIESIRVDNLIVDEEKLKIIARSL